MQFFLTFIAAIASLSTYTLLGVHADTQCAACPSSIDDQVFDRKCYRANEAAGEQTNTVCYYKYEDEPVATDFCRYDVNGEFIESFAVQGCPFEVPVDSSDCPVCSA
ncbi:hypothetical protein BS17DRAFT_882184 [Gyrodon lividus]|nr:hypothetical protein BS17DRAFT_882184 [Gyrodon lividus]